MALETLTARQPPTHPRWEVLSEAPPSTRTTALRSRYLLKLFIHLNQFQWFTKYLKVNTGADSIGFKTASFVPGYRCLNLKEAWSYMLEKWNGHSKTVGWKSHRGLASPPFHRPAVHKVWSSDLASQTLQWSPVPCVPGDSGTHSTLGTTAIGHTIQYLKLVIRNPKLKIPVASSLSEI